MNIHMMLALFLFNRLHYVSFRISFPSFGNLTGFSSFRPSVRSLDEHLAADADVSKNEVTTCTGIICLAIPERASELG